jgi:hypothetical protein
MRNSGRYDPTDPYSGIRGCMDLGAVVGTIGGAAAGAYLIHKFGESYTLDVLAGAPAGAAVGYIAGKIGGLAFQEPIISAVEGIGKCIAAVILTPFCLYDKGEYIFQRIRDYRETRRIRRLKKAEEKALEQSKGKDTGEYEGYSLASRIKKEKITQQP